MEQFEFHHHETTPATTSGAGPPPPREWVTVEPGITQMTLNEDPATGRKTVLQRWEPNTVNVKANYVHTYVEEIFLVEGDLRDVKRTPETVWEKGAYAYRKPGMDHGPFASNNGCLMYVVCLPA